MNSRNYYTKWVESDKEKVDYDFFESLNLNDWIEFWNDYINGFHKPLFHIFSFSKHYRLDEFVLPYLENINIKSLNLVNEAVVYIFEKTDINDKEKVSEILDIIDFLELKISVKSLISVINSNSINKDIKIQAAILLNQTDSRKDFWDSIELEENIFLVPFFIQFKQELEPFKAIKKLLLFNEIPDNISEFEIPIKNCLISLLKYQTDLRKFYCLLNTCPEWMKDYLNTLFTSYPELQLVRKRLAELDRQTVDIKIGLSVYPDLIFIELLEEQLQSFAKAGVKVSFKYYPWNGLFKALENEEVDIIVNNEEVLMSVNDEVGIYKKLKRFNQYEGFAIVTNIENPYVYENIKNKNIEFDRNAMIKTLIQLKDHKIFASKNTDHRNQFLDLINKTIPSQKNIFNRNSKEPYQGFKDFINTSKYNTFIGAAVHTKLLSKHKDYTVILNEATEDFGAKEYNVFVALKDKCTLSEDDLTKFFIGLKNGKLDFDFDDESNIQEWYNLYSKRLTERYKKDDDYKAFLLDYEDFRETVKLMDINFNPMNEIKSLEKKSNEKDDKLSQLIDKMNQLTNKVDEHNSTNKFLLMEIKSLLANMPLEQKEITYSRLQKAGIEMASLN